MPEEPLQLPSVLQEEAAAIRAGGDPSQPFSALCISGGGIRSATFALGAIQSLAEHGLLTQFDYLSTVSGGGYIGSWLSAWTTRLKGIEAVVPHLRAGAPQPGPAELDPVEHLREYSNYLTPKLGGLSSDTWTLVATVVRNIALNWLVLIPLLLFFLMAPRVLLAVARLSEVYDELYQKPEIIANSFVVTVLLPVAISVLFCFGLYHIWLYLPGVGGKNHTGADFLRRVLAPLAAATILFCAYDTLCYWQDKSMSLWKYILATLIPAALTWLVFLLRCGKPIKERLQLLRRLSIAIVLLAVALGFDEWIVANRLSPNFGWPEYITIVPPLIAVCFFGALAVFAGLSSLVLEDKDREWLSRASAGVLLASVLWLGACLIVLELPHWVFTWKQWSGGMVSAAGLLSGWATTLTRRDGKMGQGKPAWTATAVKFAPAIFILALGIGLAVVTNIILHFADVTHAPWADHATLLEHSTWQALAALAAAYFATAWIAARFININKFSLHGMYRDRLIRAYLGASNPDRLGDPGKVVDGGPNRFTGFAQTDNILMKDLIRRPFHVVNLTLNLVAGKRLAWQQRKAQSFTVTPLHCGNYCLGYRPSDRYGSGISLGTAMTISGAAASPNMGYHSAPATGFIMTLLNARLGAWLGNPGPAGRKTWKLAGPQSAIGSLLKEAFGLTTNQSEYVYLSDGGHFENLALYEMVLRRCRHIVVLDSGCDETFTYEDLGNALRKIRIDLNVGIQFLNGGVRDHKRCAVAQIDYGDGDPGWLVYIKPKVLGDEPPDVVSYAKQNPAFPHQSTANQWFDESQTESYRMLGKVTIDSICGSWQPDGKLADFARHVSNQYLGAKEAAATA
jgi:hypothetical protein